jgi:sulfate adenylyltransferase subunit 2
MGKYYLTHLKELEAEAIFVIREVVAQFEQPALLFSGGKDSILLSHLAKKAFYPSNIPFPLIHIDTGHNFPETIAFRDQLVERLGVQLHVGSVQESIDTGRVREETGVNASRNALQTISLLDTLEKYKIDAAMGGARRMKKRPVPKSVFSPTVMNLDSGIPKINGRNCGTFSMAKNMWVNILGYSLFPIGQKWMYGSISKWKI